MATKRYSPDLLNGNLTIRSSLLSYTEDPFRESYCSTKDTRREANLSKYHTKMISKITVSQCLRLDGRHDTVNIFISISLEGLFYHFSAGNFLIAAVEVHLVLEIALYKSWRLQTK